MCSRCPCPQQRCQIPYCAPLSCCPGCQPPSPRGNCCPSFWPPIVYQPPAQKICVVVNNCPGPKCCGNPCCPASAQQCQQAQRQDQACIRPQQQQQQSSYFSQGCSQTAQPQPPQCQFPPVQVEYVNERPC